MDRFLELENNNLSQVLEADGYLRQRLSPRPSSSAYLHLVDLREALDLPKISENQHPRLYLCRLSLRQPFSQQQLLSGGFYALRRSGIFVAVPLTNQYSAR
jgi:hypothetical protein